MAAARALQIYVQWDDEAKVYVAESEDVPGLVTEAPSWQVLIAKIRDLVPELLHDNDDGDDYAVVPWEAIWRDQSVRAQ